MAAPHPLVLVCPRCLQEIEVGVTIDRFGVVEGSNVKFKVHPALDHECPRA